MGTSRSRRLKQGTERNTYKPKRKIKVEKILTMMKPMPELTLHHISMKELGTRDEEAELVVMVVIVKELRFIVQT